MFNHSFIGVYVCVFTYVGILCVQVYIRRLEVTLGVFVTSHLSL